MKRRKSGLEREDKSSAGSARVTMSSRSLTKSSSSSVLSPNAILLIVIPAISLGAYALLVNVWEIYSGYTLIHEPMDLPFITKEWNDHANHGAMLWSSYKPNVYTSIQHAVPESVSVGFAWFVQREDDIRIHHDCITDCLTNHWTKHDGMSFGHQTIRSNEGYFMKSEFISTSQPGSGDTWTLRVTAEPLMKMQKSFLSLIVYVYNSGRGQMEMSGNIEKGMVEEIFGHTPDLKEYRIHFPYKFLTKNTAYSFLRGHLEPESNVTHFLTESLVRQSTSKLHLLPSSMASPTKNINFIAYQITSLLVVPVEMDTVFESGMYSAALGISGKRFTESSQIRHAKFDQKFENTFKLLSKGFSMENTIMCKTILSDLLGSMKYSYTDTMRVRTGDFVSAREYFPFPLLATISPNGKDNTPEYSITTEGFLQLLVLRWNPNITKVIVAHWLDTMNINGWIPGQWPVGGVSTELDTDIASAPSLFLTLESLLTQMERRKEMDYSYIRHVFMRLEVWFNWFNDTQAGVAPGTYKWKGRQEQPMGLNPETPSSGMWDYPRSSDHTHPMEYHLDLRCWITVGIRLLARLAQLMDEGQKWYTSSGTPAITADRSYIYYMGLYRELTDAKKLDQLHWDNKQKVYSDYGFHSSNVKTAKSKSAVPNKSTATSSLRHIGSVGYVSLFPLMFMILSPDSPRLGYGLKQIQDTSLLWSQYGVRSLAKNDYLYHKSNIPNGSYSWRGPIHIHTNYLLLKALRHYGNHPGPYADIANKTYSLLRKNVIDAVVKEYSRTGYTWSYYNDKTGHGMGSSSSGLSSLILLIMSEMF